MQITHTVAVFLLYSFWYCVGNIHIYWIAFIVASYNLESTALKGLDKSQE